MLEDVANNQTTAYFQHENATINQTDQELKRTLKEMKGNCVFSCWMTSSMLIDAHREEIAQKDQEINDLKHAFKDMEGNCVLSSCCIS